MMERVAGIIMAPPRPWTARNPMSHPADGATPQANEAAVNTEMPTRNKRRRPYISPKRPMVMSDTANTRR